MIQIAACVFTCFDPEKGTLEVKVERLYPYLNNLGIGKGDHALIHNGRDFGVVRVILNFTPSLEHPLHSKVQVTKPLLCPLRINPPAILNANTAIAKMEEDGQIMRLNKAANKLFGLEEEEKKPTHIYPPPGSPDYQL